MLDRRHRICTPAPRADRTPRLILEVMEDRTVPAALIPDQILLQFKPDASEAARGLARQAAAAVGHEPLLAGRSDLELVSLAPGRGSVEEVVRRLRDHPAVAFAEPNWVLTRQVDSNDPRYTDGSLWGMYGGDTPTAAGPAGTTNPYGGRAEEAWAAGNTGAATVLVGVIDEGIDLNHPDLAANIWTNPNDPADGVDNDGNGYIDDVHGWDFYQNNNSIYDGTPTDSTTDAHGTHVSGTIGAVGGNGVGVAGVNWNVRLISGKFLGPNGGNIADAVKAVDYFTNLKKGPDRTLGTADDLNIVALNNSWGGGGYSQAMHDAIIRAARAGILFVAAAGNGGGDRVGDNNDAVASYPANYDTTVGTTTEAAAAYDSVIAVAAIDSTGGLAGFSNFGTATVDLGAPGVGVLSTTPNGGYIAYSGTSMATPHVTGAAALYAAANPTATAAAIKTYLLRTAVATPSLAGKTVTGGRLNAGPQDTIGPHVWSHAPGGTHIGTVRSVRVTFNEPIAADPLTGASTFGVGDVTLTGPGGAAVAVSGVVPVPGSDTQFDVTFAGQDRFGTYTMVIGPDLQDAAGNRMNQDGDGVNGEATQDQYTATFAIGDEYASTGSAPIGGFWTIAASSITVTQDMNITDLDVRVNITHPSVGDLVVYLRDQTGRQVILSNRRGGTGDNFNNTRFDDEAGTAVSAGTAPFAGSYRPDELLSKYDGSSARGTWTLYVDNWGSSRGTVNGWALRPFVPDANPPAAPTGLIATPGSGQVALDWADNTEPDLSGYEVYRSTTSGSGYARVATVTGSAYTDTGRTNGTTYYYVVKAVDTSSNASGFSNEAAATPAVPPTKFYVVDDAGTDRTYEYGAAGGAVENYALNNGNTAPRGAASTAAGDKVWVVDANKRVYVYDPAGALLGSWAAGGLSASAQIQGIATNGADVWLVDASADRVYRYTGAASLLSGTQSAAGNFRLASGNSNPKDIVTDGASLWVVNDASTDKVFKYTVGGASLGSWTIDSLNSTPTGITLDPADVRHLWIVDSGTDRVYRYTDAASRTSGSQAAAADFALAAGNANPQGIADPPPAGTAAERPGAGTADGDAAPAARPVATRSLLPAHPATVSSPQPRVAEETGFFALATRSGPWDGDEPARVDAPPVRTSETAPSPAPWGADVIHPEPRGIGPATELFWGGPDGFSEYDWSPIDITRAAGRKRV